MVPITVEYIEQNKLTPQSKGWKILCPECGGNDCWSTYEENGRVSCFNCGTHFKVIGDNRYSSFEREFESTPAEEIDLEGIRSFYDTITQTYHSFLEGSHYDFLQHRGIDRDAINTFRIGFCPSASLSVYRHPLCQLAGIADKRGYPSLANRITFGYYADQHWTDVRGRSFSGEEPKYKSLYHSSEYRGAYFPFNWDRASKKAQESKTLILTEGEIKAVIADRFGFACVALPGMVSWRRYFMPDPRWRVVVIFDNMKEQKSRMQIDRAIERVARRIPNVFVGTLPLLGQDKQDIDSFLMTPGADRGRELSLILDDAVPFDRYKQLRKF